MELLKGFDKKQRRMLFLLFILAVVLAIMGFVIDSFKEEGFLKQLERPASYENGREVSMKLRYQGDNGEENLPYRGLLGEKKLSEDELTEKMKEAFRQVEEGMFKEGEDASHVKTGITIPERLAENPILISWEAEEGELFLSNGEISFEKLGREPKKTKLLVRAEYGERKEIREYELTLLPKRLEKEEEERRAIVKELDELLKSKEDEIAILPESIQGRKISYLLPKDSISEELAGFGVILLFSAFFYFKSENERKKEKRERELKEAYPYFVGRFVILLGAGMNLLGIWKKLSETEGFNESLAEEIRLTMLELGNGKTEREAYENFGRRTGGIRYQKFISILTENLKMGSSQILNRLAAEAREAMLDRKNHAREIGETLGTKFLMPMIFELVLIMLIIMLPAMLSTQI